MPRGKLCTATTAANATPAANSTSDAIAASRRVTTSPIHDTRIARDRGDRPVGVKLRARTGLSPQQPGSAAATLAVVPPVTPVIAAVLPAVASVIAAVRRGVRDPSRAGGVDLLYL